MSASTGCNSLQQGQVVRSLSTLVECVIPRVSPASVRIVRALIGARGHFGRADLFSRSVGLRNRDQLRRILWADGLPCLEDLAGWIRVLGWVLDAESAGLAVSRSALNLGEYPCSRYRTVKRLTGKNWGEVRLLGADWVLVQFSADLSAQKGRAAASNSGEAGREVGSA